MTDYLNHIDSVENENGGQLGQLLQEMWTTYQKCTNDNKPEEEFYVKMSHLVSTVYELAIIKLKSKFHEGRDTN